MNDKHSPPARSETIGPAPAGSGQDWTIWLQRAHSAQKPRPLGASNGQAEATWTALTHAARREGFTVERANCADAEGFTTWRNRRIRISPDAAPVQAVTALAHQLGHVLLHGQIARLEPSGTVPCTGIRKIEADSVAYLTARASGIDTPRSRSRTSPAGPEPTRAPIPPQPSRPIPPNPRRRRPHHRTAWTESGVTARTAPRSRTHCGYRDRRSNRRVTAEPKTNSSVSTTAPRGSSAARCPAAGSPATWPSAASGPAVRSSWQAGYAPAGWDALTRHLRAAGYPDTLIEAAGLARRSRHGTLIDTFRDRAMLPIRVADGTIIAFIGRARRSRRPGVPKYLNSPATALYDKSEILFGLWEAPRRARQRRTAGHRRRPVRRHRRHHRLPRPVRRRRALRHRPDRPPGRCPRPRGRPARRPAYWSRSTPTRPGAALPSGPTTCSPAHLQTRPL